MSNFFVTLAVDLIIPVYHEYCGQRREAGVDYTPSNHKGNYATGFLRFTYNLSLTSNLIMKLDRFLFWINSIFPCRIE